MDEIIKKIKSKKELSELPDSIVKKVIEKFEKNKIPEEFLIKEVRSNLRKYFGVFLTNKVLNPKDILDYETILKSHISTKKRNYDELYKFIKDNSSNVENVLDFGAGVNGFSYEFLKKYFGEINYVGFEATRQIVHNSNTFFKKKNIKGKYLWTDLLDFKFIESEMNVRNKIIFCFQITDALEKIEKRSSLTFLKFLEQNISEEELIVLSFPVESLSGKHSFRDNRKSLMNFLESNFKIKADVEMFKERFLILTKNL